MTPEERKAGVISLLNGQDGTDLRPFWVSLVAAERHFRVQSVECWDSARLAAAASKIEVGDGRLAWLALLSYFFVDRSAVAKKFLDDLGVPNENGQFVNEEPPQDPVAQELVLQGAQKLLETFDADDVALYLLALRVTHEALFPGLDEFLPTLGDQPSTSVAVSDSVTATAPVESQSSAASLPTDVAGFTTLDRRLIISIVDTAAGVLGALTEEEIDDLLLELEQLNGRRHQTFFHVGYRDALFSRPAAARLSAENESRWKWYWAGYVSGLARKSDWQEISSHFDRSPSVRTLGAEADGPGDAAAPLVFRALVESGRHGEAAAFAKPPAVTQSATLQHAILHTAVDLIRGHRAADARPLLDLLWSAIEGKPGDRDDEDVRLAVEVQRRRALCLRQLGEPQEALALLQPLAELPDPALSAIARTDIGLVRAGFRRLGEIRLPAKEADLGPFIDALELGEHDWRVATATKGFRPAHANFALGVLAMVGGNTAEASHRLDAALSFFSSSPEVYKIDGTLALCQLYLGVAICLGLDDTGRLPRAHDLIRLGLDSGAKLPVYLVRSTIDALALARADLAHETASVILEKCGDVVLDELVASSAGADAAPVRNALFRRAALPSRPVPKRAIDYRTVLPWLLADQDVDRARDALEFLESFAHNGVGRTEFVDLLRDSNNYSPAWDEDRAVQARVSLLEAEGRYTEAVCELDAVAHRLLASGDPSALDDALLVLGHLEEYGALCDASVDQLRNVIDARVKRRDDDEEGVLNGENGHNINVRILVVGGNESQARMEDDIRTIVAETLPGVTVEFLRTGWNGNWSPHADQFKRRVAQADGVVLLQMMRTMLGWTIRANCHVPWRGCRGKGQGEIVNAIRRVVPMARSHLTRNGPRSGEWAVPSAAL
jgi:tetratricopeptide (TPR) repeat protein